ncbi:cyclophilin-like fold protein [Streptococcus caballi]|uniref:cyclophilin-like fold protein n=1 Tax=Streptococcus caballi TaxID=439220 RepID=UPI00146166C5
MKSFFFLNNPLPREECKPFYIRSGDVMLYGDSGLVIFYDDLTSPYFCTKIGKIIESSNLKRSIRQ